MAGIPPGLCAADTDWLAAPADTCYSLGRSTARRFPGRSEPGGSTDLPGLADGACAKVFLRPCGPPGIPTLLRAVGSDARDSKPGSGHSRGPGFPIIPALS